MLESGLLPKGALQLVSGGLANTLDLLGGQDVVSFTGSARTALTLRSNPNILEKNIRFTAEQDSLNASLLGPDATPDTPEFDLFVKEVVREMTTKAGQKCTAIRRIMVPDDRVEATISAITAKLEGIRIGDPRDEDTQMGALVSNAQKSDVLKTIEQFRGEAECVSGDPISFKLKDPSLQAGAFLPPMLFHAPNPEKAAKIHEQEAFGPVSTIMGYRDLKDGLDLVNRGQGSLVASIFTRDRDVAREATERTAPWHGRLYFNNRDSMKESTGHGSPLPHMTHGGPGRAGGGEELGGIRGVMHYMQRTAIQGSPDILTAIGTKWVPGAQETRGPVHPFQRSFTELEIGETLHTETREVTLADVEHFAEFTGDKFYAHMDDAAARANPFFPGRVAHGYLLLSFAAGLFVEQNPGPVLANTGLDNLRFLKPLVPGETLKVRLTVKQKTKRNDDYGEVRWHVSLTDQTSELLAEYELLTMVAY